MKVENKKELKEIVLSILFVAGDGLDKDFILQKLEITPKELDEAINELCAEYNGDKGVHVIKYKNKVQLCSNPEFADYISEVLNPVRERSLTRAALETLAIIAYKQPITKLEIEDIRRVNSDYAVQILSEQNMIEVVGRKDAVGKPLLFGTTENFLKRFNLQDLADLPDYEQLLERIRVINEEEIKDAQNQGDSLYNEFELKTEELPDFLKDEDELNKVTGDAIS
ncbi:MAG TPA: SMC-Scp complex subunit ScpB [Candidatus Caccovivens faecavium]|nr:SMC-Scp complex subunit ScpB [Candidatus Caccovivens faecavium]